MGHSVLVFISHSSEDKESFIAPLVKELEDCYINVWLDKRKILPGDNLRKSIFKDGLDKADVALIFFTEQSLKSSWVDREIKHVLREEAKKGNTFDLKKIISIFDSQDTYSQISERYPELTDDLLHLMPTVYDKVQFGQLISAIWSKYLSLQGGDVENQRQLLAKDKEIFQREKDIEDLKTKLRDIQLRDANTSQEGLFEAYYSSGKLFDLIQNKEVMLESRSVQKKKIPDLSNAVAFGLIEVGATDYGILSDKGRAFFQWCILRETKDV